MGLGSNGSGSTLSEAGCESLTVPEWLCVSCHKFSDFRQKKEKENESNIKNIELLDDEVG